METRIIVGYDGTHSATTALKWATFEALQRKSSLDIVTCYDLPVFGEGSLGFASSDAYATLLDDAHRCAEAAGRQIATAHPELLISTTVTAGPAGLELVNAGKADDIIVVGASNNKGVHAFLLGSTPRLLVREAKGPVVVVRRDELGLPPARVVVGVDDSDDSRRALRWAAAEADLHGVELVVAHAWTYRTPCSAFPQRRPATPPRSTRPASSNGPSSSRGRSPAARDRSLDREFHGCRDARSRP